MVTKGRVDINRDINRNTSWGSKAEERWHWDITNIISNTLSWQTDLTRESEGVPGSTGKGEEEAGSIASIGGEGRD